MRLRTLLISLALLAAACGGTSTPTTTAPDTTVASTAGAGSTAAPQQTASPTSPSTTAAVEPEGPVAPDFTTTLADGSEFVLAAHDRPIYLIFWAEW